MFRPGLWGALLALGACSAHAQVSLGSNPGPVRDALTAATESSIVLANGPEIGTGSFRLQESDSFDELENSQLKLDFGITPWAEFGDASATPREEGAEQGAGLRGFVLLSLGTTDTRKEVGDLRLPAGPPLGGRGLSPDAEIRLTTLTLRGGGGLEVRLSTWLSLLPSFSVTYNVVRGSGAGDLFDRAILKRDFNNVLVDWRSESLTYIPELAARMTFDLAPVELRVMFSASYLETRVFSSSSDLQDFTTHSGLGVLLLEADWNSGWAPFLGMDLHVIPGFRYTRVEGDAATGLGTNDVLALEFSLQLDTTGVIPYATRLGIHGAYYFGVDLEGWTIGAAFEF